MNLVSIKLRKGFRKSTCKSLKEAIIQFGRFDSSNRKKLTNLKKKEFFFIYHK